MSKLGIQCGPRRPNDFAVELAVMQRWACWYCHGLMRPVHDFNEPRSTTLEHRVPKSRGGRGGGCNAVAACQRCNTLKGSMTDAEFLASKAFRSVMGHDFEWRRPRYLTEAA